MKWDRTQILDKLKKLHKGGASLAYSDLAGKHQALLSAATYHFGSYRKAVERAGIDYDQLIHRPRWTKPRVISLIKKARRDGEDLHWGAVTKRGDELSRAAFAALQPRLFGRWDRALHAAGLDADDVARYRAWDRNTILFELRSRAQDGEPLSSGALQKEYPGLHAAAIRYFRSYDDALRAAHLDPSKLRQRRTWTRKDVTTELKSLCNGDEFPDAIVRREHSSLYGAAIRLFGSFSAARRAAGMSRKKQKR